MKSLYKNILKTTVTSKDEGLIYWLGELSKGAPQPQIEEYFRGVASKDNGKSKSKSKSLAEKLSENKKRILYVMPLGDADAFASIKDLYPNHDLYVACNKDVHSLFHANDHVHKVLPYEDSFNNISSLKSKDGEDLFEVVYTPHLNKNNLEQIVKTNC